MPFDEYRKRIEFENFDIGLAPLDSTDFTKCKYFNKFIEYAIFGIVGIYSDAEPYTFVVDQKENGILAGDEPEDWLNAICEAVEDAGLVQRCRSGAYETLKTRFDSTIILDGLIQSIPELVEEHRHKRIHGSNISVIRMRYACSRLGDWIYKTRFYFKAGGIREVVRGIKRRIRSERLQKMAERNKLS